MKKAGKKLLLLVLAIVLLLSQTITSFALWDGLCANGRSYLGHEIIASTATGTIMQIFQLKDGESSIMPLENFETTQNNKRAFFSPVSDAEQAPEAGSAVEESAGDMTENTPENGLQ